MQKTEIRVMGDAQELKTSQCVQQLAVSASEWVALLWLKSLWFWGAPVFHFYFLLVFTISLLPTRPLAT